MEVLPREPHPLRFLRLPLCCVGGKKINKRLGAPAFTANKRASEIE